MTKFLTAAVTRQETAAETESIAFNPISIDDLQNLSDIDSFISKIWENITSFFPTLIFAVVVLVAGIILSNSILRLINKAMSRNQAASTISGFVQSLVKIILYVLFFTVALTIIGIPSTSIFAVIGSAGVAVALALQNSLSNIAGGFIIIITKPFKVGDYIECSKVSGTIFKIDIYYTIVSTIDNRKVYVPNGELSEETVTNFSENKERLVEYKFCISYDSDFETAVKLIKKTIHDSELFLRIRNRLSVCLIMGKVLL